MSSGQTLTLFVDTNLFIQCPPLEDLNWALLDSSRCDSIVLIVSRPVQREIDNQKGKGGTRVGSKARSAASLFRQAILSQKDHVVRETNPRVILRIDPHTKPDPALKDHLDYTQRDDELVGTLSSFLKQNPTAKCALLTDDTGPMASAQAHHLPFVPIPQDWLLAPETTDQDKKITRLENEVRRLTQDAPTFEILCIDANKKLVERLELTLTRHPPLTDAEIASLIARVKERFPAATDFGSREPAERPSQSPTRLLMRELKDTYEPVTQEKISEYTNKAYPDWVAACEKQLRELHDTLQAREDVPACHFAARNTGSRPATDALIAISAQGRFDITRLRRDDDDEEEEETPLWLPSPPRAPQGEWTSELFGKGTRSALEAIRAFAGQQHLFNPYGSLGHGRDHYRDLIGFTPEPHDPNAFYYKKPLSHRSGDALELTCDQWRHGVNAEVFSAAIVVLSDAREVAGAIRFRIDAENLPDAAVLIVPLRLTVTTADTLAFAERLVESLGGAPDDDRLTVS